jgi:hypothetical protein
MSIVGWASLATQADLDVFPPYGVSNRYPLESYSTRELAGDAVTALRARLAESAVGARTTVYSNGRWVRVDDADPRAAPRAGSTEAEAGTRTTVDNNAQALFLHHANPRVVAVEDTLLSRAELANAREQIQRLKKPIAGAPTTEEQFVRAYWPTIGPTLEQVGALRSPPRAERKPRWDADARTLWFGKTAVKRYGRHPAENQILVLAAFEELGWPQAIDDPLPGGKLIPTVRDLNKSLGKGSPIVFGRDGTGERITWSPRRT